MRKILYKGKAISLLIGLFLILSLPALGESKIISPLYPGSSAAPSGWTVAGRQAYFFLQDTLFQLDAAKGQLLPFAEGFQRTNDTEAWGDLTADSWMTHALYPDFLVADKDGLYGVSLECGTLFSIPLDVNAAQERKLLCTLEGWQESGAIQADRPQKFFSSAALSNQFFYLSTENLITGEKELAVYDRTTGKRKELSSPYEIVSFCTAEPGKVAAVAIQSGEDKPFYGFIQEQGSFEALGRVPMQSFGGFYYDGQKGNFYFACGGQLYQGGQNGTVTPVAYVQPSTIAPSDRGGMIANRYLLYTNDSLYIMLIDASNAVQTPLNIYGDVQQDVHQRVMSSLPDIGVKFVGMPFMNDDMLFTQLLTHDDTVDLYFVEGTFVSIAPIMEKGFAAPLSRSAYLMEQVGKMYPAVQKAVTVNGEVLALPLFAMAAKNHFGVDLAQWEEADLTPQDVPATYGEFLTFLSNWANTADDRPANIIPLLIGRDELYSWVMGAYIRTFVKDENAKQLYDPLFQSLLAQLDETAESMEYAGMLYDNTQQGKALGNKNTLFSKQFPGVLSLADSAKSGIGPMALRFDEQMDPHYEMTLGIFFVNPYSNNQETAIRYLEAYFRALRPADYMTLTPQGNEPILGEHYEENKNSYQQMKAETEKKAADAADPLVKRSYQDLIAVYEAELERIEKEKYDITMEGIEKYQQDMQYASLDTDHHESQENVKALISQRAQGFLTDKQFIEELNRVLKMIYLED